MTTANGKRNRIPKLIVFDLYGTLVKFGVAHHPYRKILKWAYSEGRKPLDTDARFLMTRNEDPESLFHLLGVSVSDELLQGFYQEIREELNSLTLFSDVIPTLQQLQKARIELAICSNLAKPYGQIIDRLLSDFSFTRVLSYEVGYIKPDDEIYKAVEDRTGYSKKNILFIGDTQLADFEGPIRYGFQARHLSRNQRFDEIKDIITS